jgi:hypothetical protein
MKKLALLLLAFPLFTIAQVGVNTTTPNAALDVQSANNGVLIPRVQLTSILDNTTIINPNAGPLVTSTLVYNIAPAGIAPNNVIAGFYYWNNTASRWIPIAATSGWELDGNTAITSPAVPAIYGTSTIGTTENFMGTTDNNDVTIGTNNIERMRVKNTTGNVGIGLATPPARLSVASAFLSPAIPDITSNGMFRIGSFNEGLDIGKGDSASNFASWFQSGYNGSTADPISFQPISGNVGIATTNPSEKLHVLDNSNANKSAVFSEVSQVITTTNFQNIAIKGIGRGSGATQICFANGVMGIGNSLNSAFATGVYAHLGTTTPILSSTNQALYANGNGLGSAGIFMGGNVGINTQTPTLARFQVDGMVGNTTALFRGNSTTSQGISMVADWPGIYFNSYYNGAIRSMAGSGFTSIINTDQSSGGLVFQTTNVVNPASGTAIASVPVRMTIAGNGNVGIGAPAPSNLLHVNSATSGAVRIVDGTQAAGRVLTSNATGVATWQPVGINNVVGTLSATGATITSTTGPYLQTGASITLPSGRYAVNVTMLLARFPIVLTANDSSFWVRSTFSDSPLASPMPSIYIEGSTLISGNLPGSNYYGLLTGTIIINNTSGGPLTFYYVGGNVVTFNTTGFITNFGGTLWAENNIIAYRLN